MPGKNIRQVGSSILHRRDAAAVASPPQVNSIARRVEAYDMHCHCLPGIDDGPATMEEAVALCRLLVADGCTAVIATPHHLGRYDQPGYITRVRTAHAELKIRLAQQRVPLEVYLGAETRLDERIPRLLENGELLSLGAQGRHLLIELPEGLRIDPTPLISRLAELSFVAILAHPERYQFVAEDPALVQRWIAAGAMIQLTASSLIGGFGRSAEAAAWHMLEHNRVHFVASDAHDCRRRLPCLSHAFAAISARLTAATAELTCTSNPRLLITGKSIQRGWRGEDPIVQPQPVGMNAKTGNTPLGGRNTP